METDAMERRLAAILSADVVGYSRLMGADEEGTLARLRAHLDEIVEPQIRAHHGRIVKFTGDGVLAEFASALNAVRCALDVQRAMAERNAASPVDRRIDFRLGINLGDIIDEKDDIHGDSVNIAVRLQSEAEPGSICVGQSVYDQVRNKLSLGWDDLGELTLKNISDPVRAYRPRDGAQPQAPASRAKPASERPSIAVLPLASFSDDRLHEYLADGLTEDIITLLARIPGFFVISRTSTFRYKGKSLDVRRVGQELGVRYVVEGSLRPVGASFRVTVQLIDAESGNHIWAEKFDQPVDDIDAAQDRITLGIIAKLEPELTRAELVRIKRKPPADLDAWSLYQQAHGPLVSKGWHEDTVDAASELLRQAVSLDPEFALAHSYLSLILALGVVFGVSREPDKARAEAEAEAERALTLDSHTSTVLGYAGCALSDLGQRMRGIEILERAVESDPSNAQAWVALGTALLANRQVDEGVEQLRRGIAISPLDPRLSLWETFLALGLLRQGRMEQATEVARSACRRDDRLHFARIALAAVHGQAGRMADAIEALRDARRIRPELSRDEIARLIGREAADSLLKAEAAH